MTGGLRTTTGEEEPDRLSPRANLVEAAAVFGLAQLALWGGIGAGWAPAAGQAALVVLVAYALVGSRLVHRDAAASWGLPRPLAFRRLYRRWSPLERRRAWWIIALLGAFVLATVVPAWSYLLLRAGVRKFHHHTYVWLTESTVGIVLAVLFGLLVVEALVLLLVRWDRWRSSGPILAAGALLSVLVVAAAAARAALAGDESPFAGLRWIGAGPDTFTARLFVYCLWGTLQQALLLGYFNGRLRKGLGELRRGRLRVALLGGALFGWMHWPSPALVAGAFVVGSLFSWLFQEDRYRHLVLYGAAHGVAGTFYALLIPGSMAWGPFTSGP